MQWQSSNSTLGRLTEHVATGARAKRRIEIEFRLEDAHCQGRHGDSDNRKLESWDLRAVAAHPLCESSMS